MVQLPEPLANFPRAQLLYPGPSSLHRLDRLSSNYADQNISVWVKREDMNSPIGLGGNKMRKLEYIVPEILARGCDTLVTIGGTQSNHCRQVAALGAKLGLKVITVHQKRGLEETEQWRRFGNQQLSRLMGSSAYFAGNADDVLQKVRDSGGNPYFIPAGASRHPLGALGFVRWAFELEEQEKSMGVFFKTVIVSSHSGATAAGMISGFKLSSVLRQRKGEDVRQRKVVSIDADNRDPKVLRDIILGIAKNAALKIGLNPDTLTEDDVIVEDRFAAGAYANPDRGTLDALRMAASMDALILDPVYSGKAFAGLLGLLGAKQIRSGTKVLFVHTGGLPALGLYSQL